MKLNERAKIVTTAKKRVGRGYGSGKGGHTTGRGAKGQNIRSQRPLYFEGTPMRKSLIRRIPMLRGKLRFKSLKPNQTLILNLEQLNTLPKNTEVTIASLIKFKVLPKDALAYPVKILGNGDLKIALTIALPISKAAAKKVEKAGGEIKAEPKAKPKAKLAVKPRKVIKSAKAGKK
ncbi:MAG: 50S ribosomal protein L15 [Patescibacteria group bacterium]|nr:50S ribosomal protein L15 [Patescibacteria group bacterium]